MVSSSCVQYTFNVLCMLIILNTVPWSLSSSQLLLSFAWDVSLSKLQVHKHYQLCIACLLISIISFIKQELLVTAVP